MVLKPKPVEHFSQSIQFLLFFFVIFTQRLALVNLILTRNLFSTSKILSFLLFGRLNLTNLLLFETDERGFFAQIRPSYG
jgi:hypothetical protein